MPSLFHFKQHRQDSDDSVKSAATSIKSPSAGPSRAQSIQSECAVVDATPANPTRPKAHRNWSFGRVDEEEQKKRRLSQDEKDRIYFAAARKYSSAYRRSQGAGIGFEGGWQ
ncbi:hypothetical protein PENDEC_c014G03334 [Penicillium decumbens]|uniref:Uncharacterized protein n=1 Tax=Penicillium decumbens TaxID=69771 RepID=A0A1V6P9W8_PENDC|nr:hypothetical protein PENDEC_c014G03334 [Penicillium decumbens]